MVIIVSLAFCWYGEYAQYYAVVMVLGRGARDHFVDMSVFALRLRAHCWANLSSGSGVAVVSGIIFMVPPPLVRSMSMLRGLLSQEHVVKSEISMELNRFSADHWLSAIIELQLAASQTFLSRGRPWRKQSIKCQSMSISDPP